MIKERQKKREEGREREGERGGLKRERVCMQHNSQNMNNIITCRGHTSRENFSRGQLTSKPAKPQ